MARHLVRGRAADRDGMDTTADAVVVGGGVIGCSILYNLAALGMRDAVLLEKDALGSGSTARSQGILRMHYSNEVTTRMAWESLKVFKDFDEALGGPSGYVRCGYLLIAGADDRQALEENVAMQKGIGVRTDVMSQAEVKEMAPALAVRDDEACAYEPESGYADPHLVTQAYARRARELGAGVRLDTTVSGIETSGGRVTGVVTRGGRISTPVAVVAAGPWSRPLLGRLGVDVPLQTVRHQVIVLRRPGGPSPAHPAMGDLVNSLSARPGEGGLTLVGVGETEQASPDGYNQGVDMAAVEEVSARLADRMPTMSEAGFDGGWSGLFTTAPDWHPILGKQGGIDGFYCAIGFSGHGFKLAPMVGLVTAETVTRGTATSIDVSMLGPERFSEGRPMRSRYGMSVLA